MPSQALLDFNIGASEVTDILRADPTPPGDIPQDPDITRALTRAALVMLCGHFERYIRGSVEEAIEIMNEAIFDRDLLPLRFKLQHSREPVERLWRTSWERRDKAFGKFFENEGWLWAPLPQGRLDEESLLGFLKAPVPQKMARLYRMWGVENIFRRITRAEHTRTRFLLRLKELVEKRNKIAHGEFTIETTRGDMDEYLDVVAQFCRRADGVLAKVLRRWGVPCAW